MNAIELIAAERELEIKKSREHTKAEDLHCDNEMAWAACYYAMPEPKTIKGVEITPSELFPENWDEFWAQRQGYKDRVQDLVTAGALIVAEIERIQRIRGANGKSD
jgi:hypothetical protein